METQRSTTPVPDEAVEFGGPIGKYEGGNNRQNPFGTAVREALEFGGNENENRAGFQNPNLIDVTKMKGNQRYWKQRPGLGMPLPLPDGSGTKRSKKRKKEPRDYQMEIATKRLVLTPGKSPTALLHEICPDIVYEFGEREGPVHDAKFMVKATYPPGSDIDFFGEGRSKKLAKNDVSANILRSLGMDIPENIGNNEISEPSTTSNDENPDSSMSADTSMEGSGKKSPRKKKKKLKVKPLKGYPSPLERNPAAMQMQIDTREIDFSSDDVVGLNFETPMDSSHFSLSQPSIDVSILKRLRKIENINESPSHALNLLVPAESTEYIYESVEGPPHDLTFTVRLNLNGQSFQATGGSKKKAKAAAARAALIHLLGEQCYQSLENKTVSWTSEAQTAYTAGILTTDDSMGESERCEVENSNPEHTTEFADHVKRLVCEKFDELMQGNESKASFKVLAGIVMTTGSPIIENSAVVAVTTGTKCIEGDSMSQEGLALNDCHAEILATRCLRDFFYSQLTLAMKTASDQPTTEENSPASIFEPVGDGFTSEIMFKLRDNIQFHLYINTAPCGDARIFSPKGIDDETLGEIPKARSNKINRGVLRAKIEAGEGTIPVSNLNPGPQTWDAIIQGNALYTMSCSDKVCRWNILGMQGALLSNLITPVYYSTITLGSLHHPVHFKRAIVGRLQGLTSEVQSPFNVNSPSLLMVSDEEKRRVKKSPNHAVCWSIGWSYPEIITAPKGRVPVGTTFVSSRVSKRTTFLRFLRLYRNKTGDRDGYLDLTYQQAKNLATKYQAMKNAFNEHMKQLKYGTWIGKPLELNSFSVNTD